MNTVDIAGNNLKYQLDGDLYGSPMWVGAARGNWECSTVGFVLTRCSEATLFFDIGAASGIFSLLASRRGSSVVAVEPDPRWLSCLQSNIALNDFASNVQVVNGAVSNFEGTASFSDERSERVLNPIVRSEMSADLLSTEVIVYDFVSLLASAKRENPEAQPIVKMDIEGAEYQILGDSRQLEALNSMGAVMQVSFHPQQMGGVEKFGTNRLLGRIANFASVVRTHHKLLDNLVRYCQIFDYKGEEISSGLRFALRVASGDKDFVLDFSAPALVPNPRG